MASTPQEKIDAYLARLRSLLRGMSPEETSEIVQELRSHILEKAASHGELTDGNVEAAFDALGRPETLAIEYMTEAALLHAEVSRSPVRILSSLFRWASISLAGFFVLISTAIGYFLGIALILCAFLKLFHPQTAGLWAFRDQADDLQLSLRMGFGTPPPNGHDVLGVWMIPIGLVAGFAILIVSTLFAIWCGRLYRRSRARSRIEG